MPKPFKQDMYALLVDFTSTFNTTDRDIQWIWYGLGFPTDAINVVIDIYTAHTEIQRPSGKNTESIPVERGTIPGDNLS